MRHSKGSHKQKNNTKTFRINYSISFEVLSTTDHDDENDSKSKKSENTIN